MLMPFKEYLESKKQLKKILQETSKIRKTYTSLKYCKVPLCENENKDMIALKPNDVIEILWEYKTVNDGTPIKFSSLNNIDYDKDFSWTKEKTESWIKKMLREVH